MRLLSSTAVIKQPVSSRDAYGALVTTWTTFATVRASINSSRGGEDEPHGTQRGTLNHAIFIRYLAGINNLMRVEIEGRTLEVLAVVEQGRKHMIELSCRELL
jgi:SPP1 family predicted phage head-tail adaptor